MFKLIALTFAVVLGLVWSPAGSAAPGPKDKAPTEKQLKVFATQVIAALIKKDIDGFISMCDLPFHRSSGLLTEKPDLQRWISKSLEEEPFSADVNEVKSVDTIRVAADRLHDGFLNRFKQVVGDDDHIVEVQVEFGGRKRLFGILIKTVPDGKLRVVGLSGSHNK